MAAVLLATAATLGRSGGHASLDTVQRIAQAITPFLGEGTGKILFGAGMTGSALVATIVVTLTAARTLGEVLGRASIRCNTRRARRRGSTESLRLRSLAGASRLPRG